MDLRARKRSPAPTGRKAKGDGSFLPYPYEHLSRDQKTMPFKNSMVEEQLHLVGHHMGPDIDGPRLESIKMCDELVDEVKMDTANNNFDDSRFSMTCEIIRNRNEDKIIREIGHFIVPSVDVFFARGEIENNDLVETVNERWIAACPLISIRPQPDFATGFKRTAFTEEQLQKILPILGDVDTPVSHFKATWFLLFPFLSSECNKILDVADRQNTHSMGIAVRAVVNLFTIAKREHELHRKILAFSISHDDRSVRIYGYYPVIGPTKFSVHRHQISVFDLQWNAGRDRWKSYCFVRNIYANWAPRHLQRLVSVLDELPEDVTPLITQTTQAAVKAGEKRSRPSSAARLSSFNEERLQRLSKKKTKVATKEELFEEA